jgi:uncharacterized membrane protein HdeD (DUF308 family)
MSSYSASGQSGLREYPLWLCLLLGFVFVIVGFVVLGDVVLATLISTFVIGISAIVAGAFEVVHAFWTKGWGGFIWQIILGLLYIAAGVLLVTQPVTGALVLTWVIGVIFLVSGVVRLVVGVSRWSDMGWLLFLSGIFGIVAGLIVLTGWPESSLWVLGLLLGIDLIFHGVGWLVTAMQPSGRAMA